MSACTVETVTDHEQRASLYDAVLAPSFGPAELPPRDEFLDGTAGADVAVLQASDTGTGTVVGCSVVALEQGSRAVALLAWLAARPGARGSGTGGALLDAAIEAARTGGADLLLAEVEDPRQHTGSGDHGNPWRRLEFYARRGLVLLELPYFQPPISPDQARVPHMLLLAQVLREGADAPDALRTVLTAFLQAYVPRLPGDDPAYDALLTAASKVTAEPLAAFLARTTR